MDMAMLTPVGVASIITTRPQLLHELPPFALPGADAPDVAIWSGASAPPRIGDEVIVNLNSTCVAHVVGYVVVDAKLGVVLRVTGNVLRAVGSPTWFELAGSGLVTVFGHEL